MTACNHSVLWLQLQIPATGKDHPPAPLLHHISPQAGDSCFLLILPPSSLLGQHILSLTVNFILPPSVSLRTQQLVPVLLSKWPVIYLHQCNMAGASHYNTYITVPTAYSDHAGFAVNDLPDYDNYNGNLQRSLSRVSDETGSYGSPVFPSPGASMDSFDYNFDSTQYVHRQTSSRSPTTSRGSYTANWTDASIPRYGDTYDSQQIMFKSSNLQPSR